MNVFTDLRVKLAAVPLIPAPGKPCRLHMQL